MADADEVTAGAALEEAAVVVAEAALGALLAALELATVVLLTAAVPGAAAPHAANRPSMAVAPAVPQTARKNMRRLPKNDVPSEYVPTVALPLFWSNAQLHRDTPGRQNPDNAVAGPSGRRQPAGRAFIIPNRGSRVSA